VHRFRSRVGCPPPYPGLCHHGPASDALSLLVMLSHGGARPSTVGLGCSPRVARTARRLPTSAIETNCEHNRPTVQTPHTTPELPPAQRFCGWLEPVSEPSQPRFHGPGAEVVTHSRPLSVAIAREGELNPNPIGSSTSCRKPASAGGWSSLHRRCALTRGTSTGSPSLTPLSRDLAFQGRFTRSPAKESALRRTRGAFHQQPTPERVRVH